MTPLSVNIWQALDVPLVLPDNEIHVWKVALDQDLSTLGHYLNLLSPDERQRAKSYQRDQDRFRFIASRGVLREALAAYLGREAAGLAFVNGPCGKPQLAPEPHTPPIHFNLSRCESLGLLAFSRTREVGVDLEAVRTDVDMDSIAYHFFTASEQAMLQGIEESKRHQMFFNCWTLKEAYLKAEGQGMSGTLDQIDITKMLPGGKWRMQVLNLGEDYAGSLVHQSLIGDGEPGFRYFQGLAEVRLPLA